ncbi:MAG: hypothetical protein GX425_17980 [Peptococcaceae bacterium]|nr:hypothetical protein [Peptococcaceae bacterium]
MPLEDIAMILRHYSIEVTRRFYVEEDDELKSRVALKAEDIIIPKEKKTLAQEARVEGHKNS